MAVLPRLPIKNRVFLILYFNGRRKDRTCFGGGPCLRCLFPGGDAVAGVKTALITGGSQGLGREIALRLAKEGYRVAVNCRREDRRARELAGLIGEGSMLVAADVSDAAEVAAMAAKVWDAWGRLDALVNNAAVSVDGLLIKLSEEDWDTVLGVNLRGCFNTTRAFAPLLMHSGGGHIVNISSVSGLRGRAGQAAYSASKAALVGLTLAAARELAGYNIRVNALVPGYMPTAMGLANPGAVQRAEEDSLLKRLTEASEVAGFVAWLLGTEYITAQVLRADSRMA